jgi:hypothetical protein
LESMGNSEIESPLLRGTVENGLRGSQQASAPANESRDGASLATKLWSRSILSVVLLCCIGATFLLLSSPQSSKIASMEDGAAIQIGDKDSDELNYFTAQRTKFHFQPEENFMSGTTFSYTLYLHRTLSSCVQILSNVAVTSGIWETAQNSGGVVRILSAIALASR